MSDPIKHSLINGLVLVGIMWAFAYCSARTDAPALVISGCTEPTPTAQEGD